MTCVDYGNTTKFELSLRPVDVFQLAASTFRGRISKELSEPDSWHASMTGAVLKLNASCVSHSFCKAKEMAQHTHQASEPAEGWRRFCNLLTWGFAKSRVPFWGPSYQGILLFGVHVWGPFYFVNPHFLAACSLVTDQPLRPSPRLQVPARESKA